MRNDELKHYGVKGMKWGVRKKIHDAVRNYRQRKLTKAGRKDTLYNYTYDKIEKLHRTYDSPTQYARWYSSGATSAQRQRAKQLRNRTKRLMKKYGKKYDMKYDVITGQYTLSDKKNRKNANGKRTTRTH